MCKILIVEDTQLHVERLKYAFDQYDEEFHVVDCDNLADAIVAYTVFKPDVVVLDLGLKDSSGDATFHNFLKYCPGAFVVVHSMDDTDLMAKRLILAGAKMVMGKSQYCVDILPRICCNLYYWRKAQGAAVDAMQVAQQVKEVLGETIERVGRQIKQNREELTSFLSEAPE